MLSHSRGYFDLKRLVFRAFRDARTGEPPRLPGHDHREDQEQAVPRDERGDGLGGAVPEHDLVVPKGVDDLRQEREDDATEGPHDRPAQRRSRVVIASTDECSQRSTQPEDVLRAQCLVDDDHDEDDREHHGGDGLRRAVQGPGRSDPEDDREQEAEQRRHTGDLQGELDARAGDLVRVVAGQADDPLSAPGYAPEPHEGRRGQGLDLEPAGGLPGQGGEHPLPSADHEACQREGAPGDAEPDGSACTPSAHSEQREEQQGGPQLERRAARDERPCQSRPPADQERPGASEHGRCHVEAEVRDGPREDYEHDPGQYRWHAPPRTAQLPGHPGHGRVEREHRGCENPHERALIPARHEAQKLQRPGDRSRVLHQGAGPGGRAGDLAQVVLDVADDVAREGRPFVPEQGTADRPQRGVRPAAAGDQPGLATQPRHGLTFRSFWSWSPTALVVRPALSVRPTRSASQIRNATNATLRRTRTIVASMRRGPPWTSGWYMSGYTSWVTSVIPSTHAARVRRLPHEGAGWSAEARPDAARRAASGPPSHIMYWGLNVLFATMMTVMTRTMMRAACTTVRSRWRSHQR